MATGQSISRGASRSSSEFAESTGVEITVYGPSHGLHSGHYGNWAPNPITRLANLIASMRNDDGRILIKDFYADVVPISPAERKAIANIPAVMAIMMNEIAACVKMNRMPSSIDATSARPPPGAGVGL